MIDLLDALELDRADLIGNSLGGRVALELALRAPERVGRLALALAFAGRPRWRGDDPAGGRPALRLMRSNSA
jgi:pimeloyl-ACP methyl ester carboxylesterase